MSLCHICIYCSWLRNWNCWCYWCLFFSTGVIGFITYNSLSHAHMRITGKTSNWCIWCIVFIDFLGSSPKRKFRGATICIEALFKYIYHGKPRFLKKNRAYFTNFLRAQKNLHKKIHGICCGVQRLVTIFTMQKTTEGLRFMQSARENDERKKCASLDRFVKVSRPVLVTWPVFLLKGSVTETQCNV